MKKEENVKRKKALRVSLNKRGTQYFESRKILQLQRSFLM
jgi:tRNA(Ser,Leu) C12 N-acetylase TAN1